MTESLTKITAFDGEIVDIKHHPLADWFPLMDGSEHQALVEDIRAHGLRSPIVMLQGKILDGCNRYRACIDAGVPVRTENFTGNDPLAYVISANLHRRHLNESQRAMAAAKLANMRQGERTDLAQICASRRTKQPICSISAAVPCSMLRLFATMPCLSLWKRWSVASSRYRLRPK